MGSAFYHLFFELDKMKTSFEIALEQLGANQIDAQGVKAITVCSAADDLLKALQDMEKWASSIYDGLPASTASNHAKKFLVAARSAIAKSTGA